jgi:Ni,Fe-hydrogenase I large subunit
MSQRITIDPVTRIEGHLRIDCEIENGVVSVPGHREPCGAEWKRL